MTLTRYGRSKHAVVSVLMRKASGALRSTIDAHGPITREWIASVAKRLATQLYADGWRPPRPRLIPDESLKAPREGGWPCPSCGHDWGAHYDLGCLVDTAHEFRCPCENVRLDLGQGDMVEVLSSAEDLIGLPMAAACVREPIP